MKLRASHQFVARLTALGLRNTVIASKTGYNLSRISQIQKSPAFKELVAVYKEEIDQSFRDNVDAYHELAVSNMLAAERQIADKLAEADDNDEFLPTRDLIAISRDAADRFGYGKKKEVSHSINADFAARLENAIRRSANPAPAIVDVTPLPVAPTPLQDVSSTVASLPTRPAIGITGPLKRRA